MKGIVLRALALAALAALSGAVGQAQEAKKETGPTFKSAWTAELTGGTSRIACADVTGDKKGRLLALEGSTLRIFNVTGEKPVKEADVDLGKGASSFVAGQFTKGKPAVIVTPGAVIYRDGEKYTRKEAADISEVTGTASFMEGDEVVFYFGGQGQPKTWGIDLTAGNPVTNGHEMVDPGNGAGVYHVVNARLPEEIQQGLGLPDEARKLPSFGFFDPTKSSKLVGWMTWVGADSSHIALFDVSDLHPDQGTPIKVTWKSPKLGGKLLDAQVTIDPKGGKKIGFLVLESTGADGKGRQAEFLAIE
ncbi:MAG: hypothetical protein JWL77_3197 [Chthonomonadaceae bacterium]|nr:hypothetical protein [Chthonomonadaceae bacterium]